MIKTLLIIIYFTFGPGLTHGLEMSIGKNNSLILSGSDCKDLVVQHQAICDWKKGIDQNFQIAAITENSCMKNNKGKYQVTVSSCLPSFVKENHHKKLFHNGANCWGTAMSFKGLTGAPRFIWPNEMKYWQQDSGLCRKVQVGEKLLPGDIINTYGPEKIFSSDINDEGTKFWDVLYPNRYTAPNIEKGYSGFHSFLHSETYISDKITFGKDSPYYLDLFDFHHLSEVYGRGRDKDCFENQQLTAHEREYQREPKRIKGTKCDYFSIAYRCENIENYLKKMNLTSLERKIYEEVLELQQIQKELFNLQKSANYKISKREMSSMLYISDSSANSAILELGRKDLSKNEELLLVLKYFSAQGIRKSLEQAKLIDIREVL